MQPSTLWMLRPERSCGRAAIRLHHGIISAESPERMAGSIFPLSTECCIVLELLSSRDPISQQEQKHEDLAIQGCGCGFSGGVGGGSPGPVGRAGHTGMVNERRRCAKVFLDQEGRADL